MNVAERKLPTYPTIGGYETIFDLIGVSTIVFGDKNDPKYKTLAQLIIDARENIVKDMKDHHKFDLYIKLIFDKDGNYYACFSYESRFATGSGGIMTHERMIGDIRDYSTAKGQTVKIDEKNNYGVNLSFDPDENFVYFIASTTTDQLQHVKDGDKALIGFLIANGFDRNGKIV